MPEGVEDSPPWLDLFWYLNHGRDTSQWLQTSVFKTSSGRLKKVTTTYDQIRRHHDVWQKTFDLRRLEDARFMTPWRSLIYDVWNTSMKRRLEDVLKTSVKRLLCSNVVAKSLQRQKKWFFLILHFLKYSENFNCFYI